MKTYILTDNVMVEPIIITAENDVEAEQKIDNYYSNQIDVLYAAQELYGMRYWETNTLENIDELI